MASHHDPHPKEESNLKTGLVGFTIGFVWLVFVVMVAHWMALSLH